jgi:hypothetical protein
MNVSKLSLAALLATAASGPWAAQDDALLAEARSLVKQFGGQLKGEVAAGMKAGGPVATIEICKVKAPLIASDLSAASGWDVARTSLKLRNPNNAPDDWERQVLEQFEARKAAGEPVAELEYAEVVGSGDDQRYRYMKAIGTEQVCLNCHAAEIKPEVEARLGVLYPEDRARGFSVGDIRGAFTLSKTY